MQHRQGTNLHSIHLTPNVLFWKKWSKNRQNQLIHAGSTAKWTSKRGGAGDSDGGGGVGADILWQYSSEKVEQKLVHTR